MHIGLTVRAFIGKIVDRTLEVLDNPGADVLLRENFVDLEYTDDIAPLFNTHHGAQSMLTRMSELIEHFGTLISPRKCNLMLQ